MAGGRPGPMFEVSISSGMGHGNPGLAVWVLALIVAGFGARLLALRGRTRPLEPRPGIPATALPGFLVAVGLLSTCVYALVGLFPDHAGHAPL